MNIIIAPVCSRRSRPELLCSFSLRLFQPRRSAHTHNRCHHAPLSTTSSLSSQQPARVRFAPSPTGQLHFGGLRTALFNYLLARQSNGTFILRIEDTDQARTVPGAADGIVNALQWAGLDYDRGPGKDDEYGPYVQSERQEIYQKYSQQLLNEGKAYRCFCTMEKLEERRKVLRHYSLASSQDECRHLSAAQLKENLDKGTPFIVRFMTPDQTIDSKPLKTHDLVYGHLSFPGAATSEDFVIVKSDGMPTYHLASVVDDHLMNISHVIRGEEWISSIPKHIQLYDAFGWQKPEFVHMPVMLNADGKKMSKRTGDWQIESYIKKGYEPEAILNFVALLGAGWPESREMLTMDDMISMVSLKKLNRNRATVDIKRLDHLNFRHILLKSETDSGRDDILKGIRKAFAQAGIVSPLLQDDEYIKKILPLLFERLQPTVSESAVKSFSYFFVEPDYTTHSSKVLRGKIDEGIVFSLEWGITQLKKLQASGKTEIVDIKDALVSDYPAMWQCLRQALTAKKSGPSVVEIIWALGIDRSLDRLRNLLKLEKAERKH